MQDSRRGRKVVTYTLDERSSVCGNRPSEGGTRCCSSGGGEERSVARSHAEHEESEREVSGRGGGREVLGEAVYVLSRRIYYRRGVKTKLVVCSASLSAGRLSVDLSRMLQWLSRCPALSIHSAEAIRPACGPASLPTKHQALLSGCTVGIILGRAVEMRGD